MKLLFVGALLLFTCCNGPKKAGSASAAAQAAEAAGLTLLLQDEFSEFERAETMIIKDQKRLNSLFSKINQTRKPGLPVPEVDFSKEMVILQCSGAQDRRVVSTLEVQNSSAATLTLASKLTLESNSAAKVTTYPFCLYKMPLTDKEIRVLTNNNEE